jgi:putative transcriptional regulator
VKIISRFRILLAEKETREHRRISLQKVSEETGISVYTIKKLNTDDLREFPMEAMTALCRYFGCTPGQLFTQENGSEVADDARIPALGYESRTSVPT